MLVNIFQYIWEFIQKQFIQKAFIVIEHAALNTCLSIGFKISIKE